MEVVKENLGLLEESCNSFWVDTRLACKKDGLDKWQGKAYFTGLAMSTVIVES